MCGAIICVYKLCYNLYFGYGPALGLYMRTAFDHCVVVLMKF